MMGSWESRRRSGLISIEAFRVLRVISRRRLRWRTERERGWRKEEDYFLKGSKISEIEEYKKLIMT